MTIRKKNKKFYNANGFTLVEMVVAVSVFLIVISAASSIFIQSLKTQRILTAIMATNDNASFSLEQMAREIRLGFGGTFEIANSTGNFDIGQSGQEIHFLNSINESVAYRFHNFGIEKCISDDGGVTYPENKFVKITADNVKVNQLKFIMFNDPGFSAPRITISLSVSPTYKDAENINTNVQTTISVRDYYRGY